MTRPTSTVCGFRQKTVRQCGADVLRDCFAVSEAARKHALDRHSGLADRRVRSCAKCGFETSEFCISDAYLLDDQDNHMVAAARIAGIVASLDCKGCVLPVREACLKPVRLEGCVYLSMVEKLRRRWMPFMKDVVFRTKCHMPDSS